MNAAVTAGKVLFAAVVVVTAATVVAPMIPGEEMLTIKGVDTRPYLAAAGAMGALFLLAKAAPAAAVVKPA